jgi:hypothetical protein
MSVRLALFFCLALGLAACERIDEPEKTPPEEQVFRVAPPQPLPGFARSDARLRVAHTGLRRLEFAPIAGSGLVFRERITTDGLGHYAIVPEDLVESSSLDWGGFELIQRAREGFHFRYRDFLVRDPLLFARNWRTIELAQPVTVAGRLCQRFRLERLVGEAVAFELAIDGETDLVLASDEFDAEGQQVASMVYESFALAPQTGSTVWHTPANDEVALDPRLPVQAQLDVHVLEPHLLPPGQGLLEIATVGDPAERWLKLTYSDGIEPLFFLQRLQEPTRGRAAQADAGRMDRVPDSTSGVAVFQVGAATAIQGQVDGFELIVVGKAPQAELLDMIESALP